MPTTTGDPHERRLSTRYARVSSVTARLVLAALGGTLLMAVVFALGTATSVRGLDDASANRKATASHITDMQLYDRVADAVRGGEGYYHAAARLHRANGYSLRPFFTVRPPTLAYLTAALPRAGLVLLLWTITGAAAAVWCRRLVVGLGRGTLPIALVATALGFAAYVMPQMTAEHEIWAGSLMALSLGMRRVDRWGAAVAAGLAAMLLRETAAGFAIIMLAAAAGDGNRREAVAWGCALGAFAVFMGVHAYEVSLVVGPHDIASPGWGGRQGVGFYLYAMYLSTGLSYVVPYPLAAVLVVLSLFGWISLDGPLGRRMSGVQISYAIVLGVLACLENVYWALLVAATLPLGLVPACSAIVDLFARAIPRATTAGTA